MSVKRIGVFIPKPSTRVVVVPAKRITTIELEVVVDLELDNPLFEDGSTTFKDMISDQSLWGSDPAMLIELDVEFDL